MDVDEGERPGAAEQLRVLVENLLDGRQTAIHWHDLLVLAGMDVVPDVSNAPIEPGQMYVYELPLLQSGTYCITRTSASRSRSACSALS